MLPGDDRPDGATAVPEPAPKPPHLGHRQRLRARLIEGGAAALPDYELLEVLLFAASPRADTKPLARELIGRFGSLSGALSADRAALETVPGLGDAGIATLLSVREAGLRLTRAEIVGRDVLGSYQQVVDYCTARLAFDAVERFHVLFLDRKNRLIRDEEQNKGTVDHTPVYPREVAKRALELGASALIMVHNHPSGDPTPSKADIEVTKELAKAVAVLGIVLHDHLVIGRGRHVSLKSQGLF